MGWTDYMWIPVERRLPGESDGPCVAEGAKIGVWVLTVGAMLSGKDPEPRGFHLAAQSFDDDDVGRAKVMFWSPFTTEDDLIEYKRAHGLELS